MLLCLTNVNLHLWVVILFYNCDFLFFLITLCSLNFFSVRCISSAVYISKYITFIFNFATFIFCDTWHYFHLKTIKIYIRSQSRLLCTSFYSTIFIMWIGLWFKKSHNYSKLCNYFFNNLWNQNFRMPFLVHSHFYILKYVFLQVRFYKPVPIYLWLCYSRISMKRFCNL